MKIRKCYATDIGTLVQMSLRTFVEAFEKDNDPHDFKAYTETAFTESSLAKELNNPHSSFYFLDTDDGQLAGYFKLNEHDSQSDININSGDTMELERIYVLAAFQGRKLGTCMLREAMSIASDLGKKQLWLGVWQNNCGAIRFYEKHGFIQFDTHSFYIGKDKQTDRLMRIDLKKPMQT